MNRGQVVDAVRSAGSRVWQFLTDTPETRTSGRVRKGSATGFFRWAMWNPVRFAAVLGAALFVLLSVGVVYAGRGYEAAEWARYERAVAAAEKQAAEATKTTVGPTVLGASAAPAPSTAATPRATAPTLAPPVTPKAKAKVDQTDPDAVAKSMLTAWAGASKAVNDTAWVKSMEPYVSRELAGLFTLTDRSQVPAGVKVVSVSTTVVTNEEASATADLGPGGGMGLTLRAGSDGKWVVVDMLPDGDEHSK